jgi:phenylacetate-coenzyme A ligase PaaK-like adenylate-forming protein
MRAKIESLNGIHPRTTIYALTEISGPGVANDCTCRLAASRL